MRALPLPPSLPPLTLGVLGGMGPLATVDFLAKLAAATPATRDQDHLRVLTLSDPTIPDRTEAILSGNEQPVFIKLRANAQRLVDAGANAVVIPCNSAHHWFERLEAAVASRFLHIADAVVAELARRHLSDARVAVLGTPATLMSGFYSRRLRAAGHTPIELPCERIDRVMSSIRAVKGGHPEAAGAILQPEVDALLGEGAVVLLACTELPIAYGAIDAAEPRLVDATDALVTACLGWAGVDTRRQPSRHHGR